MPSVHFSLCTLSKTAQALNIRLSKADSCDTGIFDRARIRFGECEGLEKFMLNPNLLPQDGKDYGLQGRDELRLYKRYDTRRVRVAINQL